MSIYTRFLGLEPPRIPVHQFMAALGEFERGKLTAQQVATAFGLSGPEQTEAGALEARILTPVESVSLGGFLTLTNIGATFDNAAILKGLGFARVQLAGITAIEFSVRVNKIGTGTQSWQLWNDTDGAEVTVIDDAGATGEKQLSVVRDFVTPLAPGVKTVRVRAKSTTAADDPVYYGAALTIRRIEKLTSMELHEVLLLAEQQIPPYDTEAALKTRLGV